MSRPLPLWVWWSLSQLAGLTLAVGLFLSSGILNRELRESTWRSLRTQAEITALYLEEVGPRADLSSLLERGREHTFSAYRVVDGRGVVVASSGGELGADLSQDAAVAAALRGEVGKGSVPRERAHRYPQPGTPSRWASERLRVAVPLDSGGAVVVVRTPKEQVQLLLEEAPGLLAVLLAALAASLILTSWISRRLTRSLRHVAAWASRVADGSTAVADVPEGRPSHVAEVRQLDGSLRSMAAELDARMGMERELAGHVAHEFRTPLSTLLGTLELLQGPLPEDRRQRFLGNAVSEIHRLNGLLSDLLALARVGADSARGTVELRGLAHEVVGDRPVVVRGGPLEVRGDDASLRLALDNLVGNAVRHGAPPFAIELQAHHDGAVVQVLDAGPGVPEADRGRVFERFFTTNRSEGSGLGLALVARVAAQHGGRARVIQGGFELSLPRSPSS